MNTNFKKLCLAAAFAAISSSALAATGGTGTGATNGVCGQDYSNAVACGTNAVASAGGVAAGSNSTAQNDGVAAGPNAYANTGVAVGMNANADNNNSGYAAVAVGNGASSNTHGVSIGSMTHSDNSGIAIGDQSTGNVGSIAVGLGATAGLPLSSGQTTNSVALGASATSTGMNSVAVGFGSTDSGQKQVFSVGSSGLTRRIINVAPGTVAYGSTDAVNGGQLATTNAAVSVAQSTANSAASLARQAQGTANTALTIANNSAQYTSPGALGLNANGGAGTLVQNVAAGQAANDAANVGQVQGAVTTANSYTDQQITALQNLINNATASGLCKYNGTGGIVCGHNTTAAAGAVAQGDGASAGYAGSLAIGQGATITAPTNPADANTTGAIAIGQGAQANADPATAIGYQANAAGANSVALGYQATAYGNNSVALGAGSVANRANSVSVGSASQQRQITNVAPGTQATDAVNLGQLEQATSGILGQANQHADEVAAMAAATSMTPQFGPQGYALTAAVAGVGGESAVGIGFARAFRIHDHAAYWQASVGFNGGSGSAAIKVGASVGW